MNKTYFFLIVLASLQFGPVQHSYTQEWQWAVSCGKGFGDEYGTITADKDGNVYLLATFGAIGIFGNDTIKSIWGGGDNLPVAFCKLSPSGNFQWVKTVKAQPSSGSDVLLHNATNIHLDGVYLFGGYYGDVYFDSVHFVSQNSQILIGRYDQNGNILWLKEMGSDMAVDAIVGCVDNQGNLYFAGGVVDTAHFDEIIVPPGIYIAKYSSSGHCIWAKTLGDSFPGLWGLTVSGNNLILEGRAGSTNPFTICGTTVTPVNYENLVLAAFDTSGNCRWAKTDGKAIFTELTKPCFDSKNNFYVAGTGGNMIFGQDTVTLINGSNTWQLVLVKYDVMGNVIWAKNSSGDIDVRVRDLSVGNENSIYITGYLGNWGSTSIPTNFGGCTASYEPDNTSVNLFVVRFDDIGECLGLKHTAIDISVPNPAQGTFITVDSAGNCVVSGQFLRTAYFDSITLTSVEGRDIFISKCGPLNETGFGEQKKDERLIIYANPNEGKCNIIIPEDFRNEKSLNLMIFDSQGKVIQKIPIKPDGNKIRLNIQAEASGIYNVLLSNGKKNYTGKVILK